MRHFLRWMLMPVVAVLVGATAALAAGLAHAQDDLEGVAAVVDVLFTGDEDAVREVVVFSQVACEAEPVGPGSAPICPEGTDEGTLVDVFPQVSCAGFWSTDLDSIIASLTPPGPALVSVHENNAESVTLYGDYVALYDNVDSAEPDTALGVGIRGGQVVSLFNGCGSQTAEGLIGDSELGPEVVLPSDGPSDLPDTGSGAARGGQNWPLAMLVLGFGGALLVAGAAARRATG